MPVLPCSNACGGRRRRKRHCLGYGNGARRVPTSPSVRRSSSAFPAKPKRIFPCCWSGSARRGGLGGAELDRVGCFRYEPVAGAMANDLGAPVPDAVKEERWNRLMQLQQEISAKRLKQKIGAREQVIIDEIGVDG